MSSGPNMLKFIWGKGQGPSAERVKVQKQLFGFSREVNHGFTSKPVCFAWDSELELLCIAAKVPLLYSIYFSRHSFELGASTVL